MFYTIERYIKCEIHGVRVFSSRDKQERDNEFETIEDINEILYSDDRKIETEKYLYYKCSVD